MEDTEVIDQGLVNLTNDMLAQLHISTKVRRLEDIGVRVFVVLWEGLCGDRLEDLLPVSSREDEIHNGQVVIDALSMDILHTSLSHITGEQIINHDRMTIANLLEIFSGLLTYILTKIDSDVSEAEDGDDDVILIDDEDDDDDDLMTPEIVDDALDRERDYIRHREAWTDPDYKQNDAPVSVPYSSRIVQPRTGLKTAPPGAWEDDRGRMRSDRRYDSQRYVSEDHQVRRTDGGRPATQGESGRRQYTDDPRSGVESRRSMPDPRTQQDTVYMDESSALSPLERLPDKQASEFQDIGVRPKPAIPLNGPPSSKLTKGKSSDRPGSTLATNALPGKGAPPPTRDLPSRDLPSRDPPSRDLPSRAVQSSIPSSLSTILPHQDTQSLIRSDRQSSHPDQKFTRLHDARLTNQDSGIMQSQDAIFNPRQSNQQSNINRVSVNVQDRRDVQAHQHDRIPRPDRVPTPDPADIQLSHTEPALAGLTTNIHPAARGVATSGGVGRDIRSSAQRPSIDQIREKQAAVQRRSVDPGLMQRPFTSTEADRGGTRTKDTNRLGVPTGMRHARSYESLANQVEDTVKLSRHALITSPEKLRHRGPMQNIGSKVASIHNESVGLLAASLNNQAPTRGQDVRSSTHPGTDDRTNKDHRRTVQPNISVETDSSGKEKRKVSFMEDWDDRERRTVPSARPSSAATKLRKPPRPTSATVGSLRRARTNSNQGPRSQSILKHDPHHPQSRRSRQRGYSSDGDSGEDRADSCSSADDENDDVYEDEEVIRRSPTKKRSPVKKASRGADAISTTRQRLLLEEKSAKMKKDFLNEIYAHELADYKENLKYEKKEGRKGAMEMEKEYKNKVLVGPQGIKYQSSVKSSVLKPRQKTRTSRSTSRSRASRRRSVSASPTVGRVKRSPPKRRVPSKLQETEESEDMFNMMLEEFPYLQLSSETWHELWRKGVSEIERLTKSQQDALRKKSKSERELEEANRKQQLMGGIMRKELNHIQRMREIKQRKSTEIAAKNHLHEKRIQSSRAQRYYDDYNVQMRAKMTKRNTKEEMVFKNLFKDGLKIQKSRIAEMRKYAKEQRNAQSEKRKNELDSMENYYRDQFDIMSEAMANEKEELLAREKAQAGVMGHMKKELRKKMETEIKGFQDQLLRDDDDVYFRELDADRIRRDLHTARYNIKV